MCSKKAFSKNVVEREMQEYIDVLIATPGHSMVKGYVKSLALTLAELSRRGLTYKFLNGYSSLVHDAREITLTGDTNLVPDDKGPLHDIYEYKYVVWIDSDIEWTVEAFFKLLDSPYEITSGAYLSADGITSTIFTQEFPCGVPKLHILKQKEIVPVEFVGFGFLCVKKGVFERIPRPWFSLLNRQINTNAGPIFSSIGEDFSWCIKAKQLGYSIYFDPSILVNHVKTATISW